MLKSDESSIIYNGRQVAYSQICHDVNRITQYLQPYISDKSVIGIALPRTPLFISAMLASIQLRVPFVPFDINIPSERAKQMGAAAGVSLLITSKTVISEYDISSTVFIEEIPANSLNIMPLDWELTNDILYILFTSGSTGIPKGVEVTRVGFHNLMESIAEIIDFSPGKRIACLTTVSFDMFFVESLMSIYQGLTVVLANEEEQRNPKLMAKLIDENDVEIVQMTPSRLQLLLNYDKDLKCLRNVGTIMIGGEPFPLGILRTLQEKTNARIYNMYGPTETTIWSTVSDLTKKDRIDIGRPIKNTEIYIIDENLNMLPDGQAGEICIAGKGIAKGYVGHVEMTAERFVILPKMNIRVYKTGDLGRRLPDGDLEYLGRVDNQLKLRGHRIEPEEIETYINRFNGIRQSVVTAVNINETDKILKAFYTSDIDIDDKALIRFLSELLPQYMLPAIFTRVESFIQTAHGKIDRKRVTECKEIKKKITASHSLSGDLTVTQKKAWAIIQNNMEGNRKDSISLDMGFESAGVDSITFIRIIADLENEFGFEFDDEKYLISDFPTIGSMLEYVESKMTSYMVY